MQNLKSKLSSKRFMMFASFLGLYLMSAGGSWALISYVNESPGTPFGLGKGLNKRLDISELPKTQACPINGMYYTEPEKEIWEQRRPATIIVENQIDARPLSGMSRADVVYEAVAEGGVTRFLGVFYCGVSAQDLRIAVVRSARVYFINWAAEYGNNPIFLHWGGANNFCPSCPGGVKPKGQTAPEVDAYALLDRLGWRAGSMGNDLDGGFNVGYPVVKREPNRLGPDKVLAQEHTPVTYSDALYEEAQKRGFTNVDSSGKKWDNGFVPWKFADDSPMSSPKASEISFEFWRNKLDFDVRWEYDVSTNSYLRFNGGKPFVDLEFDNAQISAKNVVIQFVKEKGPVDAEKHFFYETTGTGNALVFQNGDVLEATWSKEAITSRTKYFDKNKNEIEFVRGPIWIAAVPTGNIVNY